MSLEASKEVLNSGIRAWAKNTTAALKSEFDILDIQHVDRSPSPVASRDKIMTALRNRQGIISIIGFKFPKHMVFVHKGVGKGVPASRAGSSGTTRKAKEWFNPVISAKVDDLADVVANATGDLIVNNIGIK